MHPLLLTVTAFIFAIGLAGCGEADTGVTPSATPALPTALSVTPTPALPTAASVTPTSPPATPEPTPAPLTTTPEPTTFGDPFEYCLAVGTIDAPDSRYAGPPVPDAVTQGLQRLGRWLPGSTTFWRCMDGKVVACNTGVNLPCGAANTSTEPSPGMAGWCQENADSPIPAAITGHNTIYLWQCQGTEARIVKQVFDVDSRDFVADFWFEITP